MHIHIHIHDQRNDHFEQRIFSLLNKIQMDQEQLAADLTALKDQTEKAKQEVIGKIASLEQAIIDAGSVTPAVEAALAELKSSVQGVDDIVPDAPVADPGTPADQPVV